MSYCRFSSDDWQSDVYAWEDIDGSWHTEVAYRHWAWDVPLPDPVATDSGDDFEAFFERMGEITRMHDVEGNGHWIDLPEPEGGRSFRHGTPGECADNLEHLRELGYQVPQNAIDALREEQEDLIEEGSQNG